MENILWFEKSLWFGLGGVGFAILFNVPVRTLVVIFILAAIGGTTKILLLSAGINVIQASLAGAILIGVLSIPAAHSRHAPPLVFSIPSVIPMVPGVFAYKMMIGFISLTGNIDMNTYPRVLAETVNNGLKAIFILMCLAFGVAIPMLITRKSSVKYFWRIKNTSETE
jgi:uncharacterized membrane protein YjjB (DUF3815 family)